MKPVRVKTVQVKAGQVKLASAGAPQPAITNAIPPARTEVPETSNAVVAKAAEKAAESTKAEPAKVEPARIEPARTELPPQPPGHGTGNGILGVLPASSVAPASNSQAMAYADPAPRPQPPSQPLAIQQNGAIKPVVTHSGWIVQVGALETESEAQQRIEAARSQARGLLAKADPFTEPVVAKDNRKLFRARFAGLEHDQAEAVCNAMRRSDSSCITVRN